MQPVSLTLITPSFDTQLSRPLLAFRMPAGFPSPADDYLEARIDLNKHLIDHPAATFFFRVSGDSMTGAGIYDGDLLIVDRAAEWVSGSIVVACVNAEYTVKRIRKVGSRVWLVPENAQFPTIEVTEESDCGIFGRVTGSVRQF